MSAVDDGETVLDEDVGAGSGDKIFGKIHIILLFAGVKTKILE